MFVFGASPETTCGEIEKPHDLDVTDEVLSWRTAFSGTQDFAAEEISIAASHGDDRVRQNHRKLASRRCLRVLVFHGHTQNADTFRFKMSHIERYLQGNLSPQLLTRYPGGFKFLYINAPHSLSSHTFDSENELDCRTWFKPNRSGYAEGYQESLQHTVQYLRKHGAIDGLIGFSQGATMAATLASLCEARYKPERVTALAEQGDPVRLSPPHPQFKFVIAFSGLRGSADYYQGFSTPQISTPTLCTVAEFDPVVSEAESRDMVSSFEDPVVLHHRAGHSLPIDHKVLAEISRFIASKCSADNRSGARLVRRPDGIDNQDPTEVDSEDTVPELDYSHDTEDSDLSEVCTPAFSPSASPSVASESLQGYFKRPPSHRKALGYQRVRIVRRVRVACSGRP